MNNSPVGIFDSGVGGLSIFSVLKEKLPNENYIYYGDTLNLPYGDKSKEQLIEITRNIFNFFKSKNVKAVVMACNTTSALTYDVLKDEFDFKIYPMVQNVSESIAELNFKKIGVFATNATVNSHAYKMEIQKSAPDILVFEQACPSWVSIVENNRINEKESVRIIKSDLETMLKNNPEKIILGCTHYPYLLNVLSEFCRGDIFINPAEYFVEYIIKDLIENNLLSDNNVFDAKFYVSGNHEKFVAAAKLFYEVKRVERF